MRQILIIFTMYKWRTVEDPPWFLGEKTIRLLLLPSQAWKDEGKKYQKHHLQTRTNPAVTG